MGAFALAYFLLVITPGPGVLSTAGVGSAYGFRPGLRYLTGLWLGNNLVALAVVSGVAAIVLATPWLRIALTVASAAYLLYLAAKIAFSGSKIAFIHSDTAPGFVNGVLLQVINPKAYAVNTTMFSGFAFMPDNLLHEAMIKFLIANSLWIPIHFAWLGAGVMLDRLDLAPHWHRIINIGMALAMLGVVALATLYRS